MKYALFYFFALLLIVGCQKVEEQSLSPTEYQITQPMARSSAPIVPMVTIRCRGNCGNKSGGGDQCPMSFDLNTDILRCECAEGCSMYVSNGTYSDPLSGSVSATIEYVSDDYKNHSSNASLDSVEIYISAAHSSEFVKFYYRDSSGQPTSVAYSIGYEQSNEGDYELAPGDPIWKVDCSGSCDSEDICTETWNSRTGVAACSCESDNCSMFVQKVDRIGE